MNTSINFIKKLYNTYINCNTPVRNLGFIIDSNMNYKTHIDNIFKISNFSLYNIRQIGSSNMKKACLALVKSLLLSNLDFFNLLLLIVY